MHSWTMRSCGKPLPRAALRPPGRLPNSHLASSPPPRCPCAQAFEGLCINEFRGLDFEPEAGEAGRATTGEQVRGAPSLLFSPNWRPACGHAAGRRQPEGSALANAARLPRQTHRLSRVPCVWRHCRRRCPRRPQVLERLSFGEDSVRKTAISQGRICLFYWLLTFHILKVNSSASPFLPFFPVRAALGGGLGGGSGCPVGDAGARMHATCRAVPTLLQPRGKAQLSAEGTSHLRTAPGQEAQVPAAAAAEEEEGSQGGGGMSA